MLFRSDNQRAIKELRNQLAACAAQLSFQYIQHDPQRISRLADSNGHSPSLLEKTRALQIQFSRLEFDSEWTLDQEIALLQQYIAIETQYGIPTPDFELDLSEHEQLRIKALSLFPLVQNALHYGYVSPKASPMKIRLVARPTLLRMEVSHQANPYLLSQTGTPIFKAFLGALDWLYPERAELLYNSNSNRFKATLSLQATTKK